MKGPILLGNWKLHKTREEAHAFVSSFLPLIDPLIPGVGLAPCYTAISALSSLLAGTALLTGAQNLSAYEKGAHTGEVSAEMLEEAGAQFVLIGHSERRHAYGEPDELIREKLKRAQSSSLRVVYCVGETEEERENDHTLAVLHRQLDALESLHNTLIAYEPVWAIGTGKTATPQLAADAHSACKAYLKKRFGAAPGVLYGGSATAENAASLMEEEMIDGLLVGGASLDPSSFARIVNLSREVRQ